MNGNASDTQQLCTNHRRVCQILVYIDVLERDVECWQKQNNQGAVDINPAENGQDLVMQEEILTVDPAIDLHQIIIITIDSPVDHDRILHTVALDRMTAKDVSHHLHMIYVQRMCQLSSSF